MTVDIRFGKIGKDEDGDDRVFWPGDPHEDDGTKKEHTIFHGQPIRSASYSGFAEWVQRDPMAAAIQGVCWREDFQITRIDTTLLKLIAALKEDGPPIDRDRARWFKYWARRAVEEFGEDAGIYFW